MSAASRLVRSRRSWVVGLFLLFLLLFSAGIAASTEGDSAAAAVRPELGPAAVGSRLLSCSDNGDDLFTTDSNAPVVLRRCTLTVPEQGVLYISADATAGYTDGDYEALFDVNIDSTSASGSRYRHVAVDSAGPAGKHNTFAVSSIKWPISQGRHTVYLLVSLYGFGPGTVSVVDSSLSVLYVPDSDPDLVTCRDYSSLPTTTTETTYQVVNECSLNAPANGWVYISADAHADTDTGYYGAMAKINIDELPSVSKNLERQFDVEGQGSSDDTDATVSVAGTFAVAAGSHDFYFLAKRIEGAGTVRLNKPLLNVIYSPWTSPLKPQYTPVTSGHVSTITGTGMLPISAVQLQPTENRWAFISANAHVSATATCIGHFRIGLDSTAGDADFDRFVALHPDSGGVMHKALAITGMVRVTAGHHWAYLVGEKVSGADCTIHVIDPSLTVLIFEVSFPSFLPLVSR